MSSARICIVVVKWGVSFYKSRAGKCLVVRRVWGLGEGGLCYRHLLEPVGPVVGWGDRLPSPLLESLSSVGGWMSLFNAQS